MLVLATLDLIMLGELESALQTFSILLLHILHALHP
jgi:hypothetical protein